MSSKSGEFLVAALAAVIQNFLSHQNTRRADEDAGEFSLAGKIALVTGASRGIGAAIAKALAEAGADVAVVGRGEQLNAVADEIRSLGRRGLAMRTDLSQPGICAKVVQDTLDQYGSLDIVSSIVPA